MVWKIFVYSDKSVSKHYSATTDKFIVFNASSKSLEKADGKCNKPSTFCSAFSVLFLYTANSIAYRTLVASIFYKNKRINLNESVRLNILCATKTARYM